MSGLGWSPAACDHSTSAERLSRSTSWNVQSRAPSPAAIARTSSMPEASAGESAPNLHFDHSFSAQRAHPPDRPRLHCLGPPHAFPVQPGLDHVFELLCQGFTIIVCFLIFIHSGAFPRRIGRKDRPACDREKARQRKPCHFGLYCRFRRLVSPPSGRWATGPRQRRWRA